MNLRPSPCPTLPSPFCLGPTREPTREQMREQMQSGVVYVPVPVPVPCRCQFVPPPMAQPMAQPMAPPMAQPMAPPMPMRPFLLPTMMRPPPMSAGNSPCTVCTFTYDPKEQTPRSLPPSDGKMRLSVYSEKEWSMCLATMQRILCHLGAKLAQQRHFFQQWKRWIFEKRNTQTAVVLHWRSVVVQGQSMRKQLRQRLAQWKVAASRKVLLRAVIAYWKGDTDRRRQLQRKYTTQWRAAVAQTATRKKEATCKVVATWRAFVHDKQAVRAILVRRSVAVWREAVARQRKLDAVVVRKYVVVWKKFVQRRREQHADTKARLAAAVRLARMMTKFNRSNQTKSNQTKSSQTKSNQTKSNQTNPPTEKHQPKKNKKKKNNKKKNKKKQRQQPSEETPQETTTEVIDERVQAAFMLWKFAARKGIMRVRTSAHAELQEAIPELQVFLPFDQNATIFGMDAIMAMHEMAGALMWEANIRTELSHLRACLTLPLSTDPEHWRHWTIKALDAGTKLHTFITADRTRQGAKMIGATKYLANYSATVFGFLRSIRVLSECMQMSSELITFDDMEKIASCGRLHQYKGNAGVDKLLVDLFRWTKMRHPLGMMLGVTTFRKITKKWDPKKTTFDDFISDNDEWTVAPGTNGFVVSRVSH